MLPSNAYYYIQDASGANYLGPPYNEMLVDPDTQHVEDISVRPATYYTSRGKSLPAWLFSASSTAWNQGSFSDGGPKGGNCLIRSRVDIPAPPTVGAWGCVALGAATNPRMQWTYHWDEPSNLFTLQSNQPSRTTDCMTVSAGGRVITAPCNAGDMAQQWKITPVNGSADDQVDNQEVPGPFPGPGPLPPVPNPEPVLGCSTSPDTCPEGSVCNPTTRVCQPRSESGGAGLLGCDPTKANSCPSGQTCVLGSCVLSPVCKTNSDCDTGLKCSSGKCVNKPSGGGGGGGLSTGAKWGIGIAAAVVAILVIALIARALTKRKPAAVQMMPLPAQPTVTVAATTPAPGVAVPVTGVGAGAGQTATAFFDGLMNEAKHNRYRRGSYYPSRF